MNYRVSYDRLLAQLLHGLLQVETQQEANDFSCRAEHELREEAAKVEEFYVGEFLRLLADAVVSQVGTTATECLKAINDAKLDASLAKVELQARLEAARAAGDRDAEHAVWRDREERQAACQAKVDDAERRADLAGLRIPACSHLMSAFGFGGK